MPKADFPEREALDPILLQTREQLRAYRPVDDAIGMRVIDEKVRQVERVELLVEPREKRIAGQSDIDGAQPDPFECRRIVAKLARGVHGDNDGTVGTLLHFVGEVQRCQVVTVRRRLGVGQLERRLGPDGSDEWPCRVRPRTRECCGA